MQISTLNTIFPRGKIISETHVMLKRKQSHSVFGLISAAALETGTNMATEEKLGELLRKRGKLEEKWKMVHKVMFSNIQCFQILLG